MPPDFATAFEHLTGYSPFPWQRRLYDRFVQGEFPPCSLPTGLGKTSVISVWLLALAEQSGYVESTKRVPRRLAYVVNRRTIVDQATREAEKFARLLRAQDDEARFIVLRELRGISDTAPSADQEKLREHAAALGGLRAALLEMAGLDAGHDLPLAISTLRGQFADNGEWSADPARPAIIVGTVDMIGSRLLFSGYGRGFKHRPLHAGFLGQDTLLAHDEAHLEPAFQKLLDAIKKEQDEGRCRDFRPFHVMPLTATPRTSNGAEPFELTDADRKNPVIKRRLEAKKAIELHPLDDERKSADKVAELAIKRAESDPGRAILVFVRKVEDVKKVVDALGKAKDIDMNKQVEQLTGTLRGKERDELVVTSVFQRFLPESRQTTTATQPADAVDANQDVAAKPTVFLVCTSAGEVGVDISADHLVCDLTTFDSMAQRFGRVNRYGDGDAKVDVVHPEQFSKDGADKEYQSRREKTLDLMRKLDGNGSPKNLGNQLKVLVEALKADGGKQTVKDVVFTPEPQRLPATDILFDAWALTSIREKMPGRPPVADWLHGVAEWEPETQVAWREEVQWITGDLFEVYKPEDLLEVYPLKPHELLKDRSRRVFEELKQIAKRVEGNAGDESDRVEVSAWVEDDRGIEVTTLQRIVERDEGAIANRTVILSPFVGGLSSGMLDGRSPSTDDVSNQWFDEHGRQRRKREWDTDKAPPGMRAVRSAIDFAPDTDESEETEPVDHEEGSAEEEEGTRVGVAPRRPGRVWTWYALPRSADDDGSRAGTEPVELRVHTADVERNVTRIVKALGFAHSPEGRALISAARWHDFGKDRRVWQMSIWNNDYPNRVLAKPGRRRPPRDLSRYRHEFGSLLDVLLPGKADEWEKLTEEEQELVLHFIAAHHGRARPHFPEDEAFDPERPSDLAATVAREVPRRFARLQRKYGRWGLAYLESILRAADAAASAEPSETVKENADEVVEAAATGGAQ